MASTTPPLLVLDREECLALERSISREWLEVDGLGGYASSTVLFCPTRRYHGLLVARPPRSDRRHLFLSRFEETIHEGRRAFPISMARYPGTWAPLGHLSLESFELRPWPSSVYRIGRSEIRREVQMVRGSATVLCRYRFRGTEPSLTLGLRPLLAFREADELTFKNAVIDPRCTSIPGGLSCRPYGALPAIHISLGGTAFDFEHAPLWYRDIEYGEDMRRGYPGREDQFCPGALSIELAEGEEMVVAATIEEPVADPAALWQEQERQRRSKVVAAGWPEEGAAARIALSAGDFLYRAPNDRRGINAGFPWFGEWGRDTFIALPGLTLSRGRLEECGEVLTGALEYLQDGLLPNIYATGRKDSHYGSADASLWYARAVRLWERAGGDHERLRAEYLPALVEIADSYLAGTEQGIESDDSSLIRAGSPELNATWMDARCDGVPMTPRDGYPVEINALWYALLRHLELLHDQPGDQQAKRRWMRRRRAVKRGFLERFWLDEEGYLVDVWREQDPDRRVRPNMLIAAAQEFSPLTREQRRRIVQRSQAELLTPHGLRTLSPIDADYRGVYAGSPFERDSAYHQGTVWPWLLGFHCEAHLRAFGNTRAERAKLAGLWAAAEEGLDLVGLEHISEVFDGDSPHRAGGSFAQAWNSAEYLRTRAMLRKGP